MTPPLLSEEVLARLRDGGGPRRRDPGGRDLCGRPAGAGGGAARLGRPVRRSAAGPDGPGRLAHRGGPPGPGAAGARVAAGGAGGEGVVIRRPRRSRRAGDVVVGAGAGRGGGGLPARG